MKKRSLQILNLLLNAKQGISGKALANKLQVSARTVRNDINEINAELSAANCQIHSSPALGYSIENEEKERILSFLKLKEASLSFYPDTPSERELYLSLRLLLSGSQAHSIETLADSIYVSKTTVFSDIRHLNEGCGKTFAFEIIFSASSGISFSGKERNLRRFLSYLISHHYESNLPYLKQIIKYFLHCQDALLFALYDEIMQILDGLSIVLTDKDLFLFIIEYLITLRRSQLGYPLEKEDAAAPDTCFFHFPYERLQAITHIFVSVEDARYLDDCFSLKHFLTNHNDMIKDELSASIIAQYLELLKKDYRIDLSDDTMLKENLIRHLNTMLRRIRLNDVRSGISL